MCNQFDKNRGSFPPVNPQMRHFAEAAKFYETVIVAGLEAIVSRYGRHSDYPWIDTKFNPVDWQDFSSDDPIRSYNTVYGWTQGRGLDALAGHAALTLPVLYVNKVEIVTK